MDSGDTVYTEFDFEDQVILCIYGLSLYRFLVYVHTVLYNLSEQGGGTLRVRKQRGFKCNVSKFMIHRGCFLVMRKE